MERISIDRGVFEKSDNVYCARATFTWDDLGTFDSLEAYRRKMAKKGGDTTNVFEGDVIEINSTGCFVKTDEGIVAIVGEGMKHTVGLAARTFKAVAEAGVSLQMISQGANKINLSFLIDDSDIEKTIPALHAALFTG